MRFSLISPTFDRPEEVQEFILSVSKINYSQDFFEVILADGTPGDTLRPIIEQESKKCNLPIRVIHEEYLPVSDARNAAAEIAHGEYLIFFDSDCIIPRDYLNEIDNGLRASSWEVFGGPDAAPPEFSALQKAISFSMTSFWTTGGIRGGRISTSKYYPRGFNMGVKKDIFIKMKGFDTDFKTGEDVELSIRLVNAKYKVGLISKAFVFHKRRSTLLGFYKQVRRFGGARWHLSRKHEGQLKLTHMFPVFLIFFLLLSFLLVLNNLIYPLSVGVFYFLIPFILSGIKNKSLVVGIFSIITTFVMMFGYAFGFLEALFGGGAHKRRG